MSVYHASHLTLHSIFLCLMNILSCKKFIYFLCSSWFILHSHIFIAAVDASPVLPSTQYTSLWYFYNATNGLHWIWKLPEQVYGNKWDFNDTLQNPCTSNWQGLSCFCNTQNCTITRLQLSSYGLDGSIPESISQLWNLTIMNLSSNYLEGTIPTSLGELSDLQTLDLTNNYLNGTIPTTLGELSNLQLLNLKNNHLSGTIPEPLSALWKLEILNLEGNRIEGSIPPSLSQLSNLQYLNLGINHLNGTIPASLGQLTNLTNIYLSFNLFRGILPVSFSKLSKLEFLYLSDTLLSEVIPPSLGQLSNMKSLDLRSNYLNGTIPPSFGQLSKLQDLYLTGNRLSGTIPATLGQLSNLSFLYLGVNRLTGTIPPSFGDLSRIYELDLHSNRLNGTIPESLSDLSNLTYLGLNSNELKGTIPASLCKLSNLFQLDLKSNSLSGSIPEQMGELLNLSVLYFSSNKLSGPIPKSLGRLSNLVDLDLSSNELQGIVPVSIASLLNLQSARLENNLLVGTLPTFDHTSALISFDCHNNSLSGDIVFSGRNLLVTNFAYNRFGNGSTSRVWLPPGVQYLNLSGNMLTGSIETVVNSSLRSLVTVDLSHNQLTGTVGKVFTEFRNLTSLVLADNRLRGNIGDLLNGTGQLMLESIDVSDNRFTGSIPSHWFFPGNISSIAVTSNCLTGGLPATVCSARNLVTLVLDGMGSSCNKPLFGAWAKNIYTLPEGQHSLYSCLFDSLPHLQTLHLSGTNMKGSLPAVEMLPIRLQYLSLANNHLKGSIPEAFYLHRHWVSVDVSFNRFTGGLYNFASSNASLKLEQNRMSGSIPVSIVDMKDVNVLNGNMFSCGYEQSTNELPQSDSVSEGYQCGSNQVNMLLIGWLSLLVATGLLIIYFVWFYYGEVVENAGKQVLTLIYSDPLGVHQIIRTSLLMTGAATFILLPIYCLLKIYYGTYTYQYAFTGSSGYISGVAPAILLVVVYWCLLGGCVYVLSLKDVFIVPSSDKEKTSISIDLQTWIRFVAMVILSAIATIAVNAMYVYAVVMHVGVVVDFALVAALAVIKLLSNHGLLSTWLGSTEVMTLTMTALLCFNNVIVPYLGEAFVSGNCFLYATFQAAPEVSSLIAVQTCGIWLNPYIFRFENILPSIYPYCVPVVKTISYQPPFIYNFSCSASLLSNFVGVFIVRFVLSGNVIPLIQWAAFHYLQSRRDTPTNLVGSVLYKGMLVLEDKRWAMCRRLGTFATTSSVESLDAFVQSMPMHSIYDHRKLVSSLLSDMFVLLSFGVMYPPLSVVICISIVVHVCSQQLVLNTVEEYVAHCSTDVREAFHRHREEETARCLYMIQRPLPAIMWFTAAFWSYSLFDTMGDAVGMVRASSMVVVMCVCPFFWYGVFWMWDYNKPQRQDAPSDKVMSVPVMIENPLVKGVGEVELRRTYVSSSSGDVERQV